MRKLIFRFFGAMIPPYFKFYAELCPCKGSCKCPMWNCYYHFYKGRYTHWCMYKEVKLNVQGNNLYRK